MKKNVADLLTDEKKGAWESVVENAPLIMAIFSNFIVIVADVRVYDVMYRLTDSWWKALLSSLACAIPFIIWEIAWQYNHTTESWRVASLVMAGLAFATSLFLGVADYLNFTGIWTNWLLGGVVIVTGVHGVVGLLYYYNDPDVARKRHKAQAEATMLDQQENTAVTRGLLESGRSILGLIEELERQYSPDDVRRILSIVSGKKPGKPAARPAYAQTVQQTVQTPTNSVPWISLDEFLSEVGLTKGQAKALVVGCKDHDAAFKKLVIDRGMTDATNISGKNFRKLYYGELNPTKDGTKNNS